MVFGRPLQVTVRTMLWDRCPVCPVCPVSTVGVLWPNGWMDQDATWYGGSPRPRRHCVRWGVTQLPPRKGTQQPHSLPLHIAHVYYGQTAGWIRIPLCTDTGLAPHGIVLDGNLATPTERGTAAAAPRPFGRLCSGTVAHLSNC